MPREDRVREQVVDEILRRVLDHRDLLEHDLALGVEVGERRREDHVRHHVERVLEMAVRDARVDDRVLARGRRVQLAAHLVEDLRDPLRIVGARPLEQQVLDEVRDPGLRVRLVTSAGADPETKRDRADAGHALGDQPLAGVELGQHVFLHGPDRTRGLSISVLALVEGIAVGKAAFKICGTPTERSPRLEAVAHTVPDPKRWWALALLCSAFFMVILDVSIVNVALPSIQRDLHFSQGNLQWILSAYALTFGGFLLLGGRVADILGRRRVFMSGVALFTLASLACGLSSSEGQLIAARAVQGLGAAILSPSALSIITTTFDEGSERTRRSASGEQWAEAVPRSAS